MKAYTLLSLCASWVKARPALTGGRFARLRAMRAYTWRDFFALAWRQLNRNRMTGAQLAGWCYQDAGLELFVLTQDQERP